MKTLKIDEHIEFRPKAFVRKHLFEMGELYFNMYCIKPRQKNPPGGDGRGSLEDFSLPQECSQLIYLAVLTRLI